MSDIGGKYINLSEVTDRFEELETELQEAHNGADDNAPPFSDWVQQQADGGDEGLMPTMQDAAEEYLLLKDLLEELAGSGGDHEWRGAWYPSTLIADSAFVEYAQELAEAIGAVASDMCWPACHIDWDAAANALQSDYSSVTFDGEDYWYR